MSALEEVQVPPLDLGRFRPLLGEAQQAEVERAAERLRKAFEGRTIWNVNSTARGGGVAEMLQSLLAYARGAGVDTRWIVIRGDARFFEITKRIHNGLHGSAGDGGALGPGERAHYEAVLRENADELRALVKPGDVVLLHDPQTLGLVEALHGCEAVVVWRCHVGYDGLHEDVAAATWEFLRRWVDQADAWVFSRDGFAPRWLDRARLHVIPPSIDPFSAKNQPMEPAQVRAILAHVGILNAEPGLPAPTFVRRDGSPGRVDRFADVLRCGPSPSPDSPLVVQVSRWDALKDMGGVMEGFARFVDGLDDVHLALVGPNVSGVSDDPEGAQVLQACVDQWRTLSHSDRSRVQLVCLPMSDVEENAAIVNALQRHATVVVQKSLQEGFGLTVAEAMWKERAVIASEVGGIREQIRSGEHGVLLEDPTDLEDFGRKLRHLLDHPDEVHRLGRSARAQVRKHFLGPRHLAQFGDMLAGLIHPERAKRAPDGP